MVRGAGCREPNSRLRRREKNVLDIPLYRSGHYTQNPRTASMSAMAMYRRLSALSRFDTLKALPVNASSAIVNVQILVFVDSGDCGDVARVQPHPVITGPRPTLGVGVRRKSYPLPNSKRTCSLCFHLKPVTCDKAICTKPLV